MSPPLLLDTCLGSSQDTGRKQEAEVQRKSKETKKTVPKCTCRAGVDGCCIPSRGGNVSVLGRWKNLHVTLLFLFFFSHQPTSSLFFPVRSGASDPLSTVANYSRFRSRSMKWLRLLPCIAHLVSQMGPCFSLGKGIKQVVPWHRLVTREQTCHPSADPG